MNEVNIPSLKPIITSPRHERLRVLLVGSGEHARESRGPALLALADEGVELAALASPTPARRAATAAALGVAETYGSVDAALAAGDFDAAVIVAPVDQHEPLTVACLCAGLHVLCEKPMAADAAAARRMDEAARAAGRVLAIGYQYPFTQPALEGLADGGFRRAEAWWVRRDGIPPQPAFWDHPTGGPGEDLLGHLLSVVALGLPGRPSRVRARARSHLGRRIHGDAFRGHDTLEADIDFDDGRSVHALTSWATTMADDEALGVRFYGTDRTLEVPLLGASTEAAFVAQMRNWARACRGAEPLRHDARTALEIQEVIDAALASAARDGAAVDLPDSR